jgi:hypothetical protein
MPPCPVPLCRAAATRPSHRRKAIIPTYAAASPMPDPHLSFPSPGRSTEEEKMPPPHARCLVLNRALRRRRAPNRYAHQVTLLFPSCCAKPSTWTLESFLFRSDFLHSLISSDSINKGMPLSFITCLAKCVHKKLGSLIQLVSYLL